MAASETLDPKPLHPKTPKPLNPKPLGILEFRRA